MNKRFCPYCGAKLDMGARFCKNCGSPINKGESEPFTARQQKYAGDVRKCPACGENIPSFTAVCPSCGHEINSSQVTSSLKEFTALIDEADNFIAFSPAVPKRGWKSWGKGKKFGWIILNLYTLCIPLVLYLVLPLLGIGRVSALTPEEKKKAQIIGNYSFPNDRESILEGLLYIKSQTEALSTGKKDRNTYRWIKIWKNKAAQLFEKAEIMFKGDKIANDTYSDILKNKRSVKKSLLIKAGVAAALVVAFAGFVFSKTGALNSLKARETSFEWPNSGIALQIPEPPSKKGSITFNDDKDFWLNVRGITQNQYEEYIGACKEKGFTVEGEKDSISYEAYNEEGYHLKLIHTSSGQELTIRVKAPEPMSDIRWPESKIAKRLPVPKSTYGYILWEADNGFVIYLGNTSVQEYNAYIDAVMDAGFVVDYYRQDDRYFRAKDKAGYQVYIDYQGNNVMHVRIDEPN